MVREDGSLYTVFDLKNRLGLFFCSARRLAEFCKDNHVRMDGMQVKDLTIPCKGI